MRAYGTFEGKNVEVGLRSGKYVYADFTADIKGDYENDPPVMYDRNGTGYPGDVGYEIEDIDIGEPELTYDEDNRPDESEAEEIAESLRDYVETNYDRIEWEVA